MSFRILDFLIPDTMKKYRELGMEGPRSRLDARFKQPEIFQGANPDFTVQDMMDYEKVTGGTPWPKRENTVGETLRMNEDLGMPDVAVNLPTEALAEPMTAEQQMSRKMNMDTNAKLEGMDAMFKGYRNRAPEGVSERELYNMAYGYPGEAAVGEMWGDLTQGPGGSWLQRNNAGKYSSVVGPQSVPESWGEAYEGPDGSLLQKNNQGQVKTLLNRSTGGDGEARNDRLYQQIRSQIMRLWGHNEFSRLDEDTSKKIEEATELARRYFDGDPSKNLDTAVRRANEDVRGKFAAAEAVPTANPRGGGGFGDNESQTLGAVTEMLQKGWTDEAVKRALVEQGWPINDAVRLMTSAKYNHLRSRGMSPEQAGAQVGAQ
ncbi:MAG: hypothetical protein HKM93_08930 [Desulfobacteraceae bacterium]|nr:hypothetical protein [Desulfobacteraceae bacterium]